MIGNRNLLLRIGWLTLFSIAMGYMESTVVVYLRLIYYPDGFTFPLAPMAKGVVAVEFFRELATIIMLAVAGIIAGRTTVQKFSYFIMCFAIWDIFYYVFLYVILGWPETLFDWDILFLIPVPWVGPVLSPLIICILMIGMAALLLHVENKNADAHLNLREWGLAIVGSMIIILSWTWDSWNLISESAVWKMPKDENLMDLMASYIPETFRWWVFGIGVALIVSALIIYYYRNRKKKQ